jgi:hypothetical protein
MSWIECFRLGKFARIKIGPNKTSTASYLHQEETEAFVTGLGLAAWDQRGGATPL